jgi:cysteine desulfurase
MTGVSAYLDYNATAPLRREAVEAMVRALGRVGNPSSVHAAGRAARQAVEEARLTVAELVGAAMGGVVFTSGGSEANALGLTGWGRRRVIASAVEHASVLQAGPVEMVPVDRNGLVDLAALERLLFEGERPAVVAVMLANNETGVIQPVAEVAAIAHAHGALVHCDAVQAVGKLAVDIEALGVDSLALSAHKMGGPQGVGALVLANPEADILPLVRGGGQERRRRAGTENLAGIAGFAAVAMLTMEEGEAQTRRVRVLRDRLEAEARALAPEVVVLGGGAPRLVNTSCLALPGLSAQTAVMALDLDGVAVSAGAACSSGKVGPSHVLAAMGAGPLAGAAIRVSLGWASSATDIDAFLEAYGALVRRHNDHRAAQVA